MSRQGAAAAPTQGIGEDRSALSAGRRRVSGRTGASNFSVFLGTGRSADRTCQRPLQRPRRTDSRTVASIAATGFGLTALCIGSERRYVSPCRSARPRDHHAALSVQADAHPSRILLSLGQHTHGRADLGFGNLVHRYRDPAVRRAYLPPPLPLSRDHASGDADLQPRGLDLALGRHIVCCRTAGRRKSGSCIIAGTITAS